MGRLLLFAGGFYMEVFDVLFDDSRNIITDAAVFGYGKALDLVP